MIIMSENVSELFTALSKAQGELRLVETNKTNPHFKNKYADLGALISESRSTLAKHGLAVCQTSRMEDGKLILITVLTHSSGQWIKGEMPVFAERQTPQGFGSALTYFRRYAFSAITGCLAGEEDDDANEGEAQVVKNQIIEKAASKPVPKISKPQKDELEKVQKKHPKLIQNAIASLGKDKTIDDITETLYKEIMRRVDILEKEEAAKKEMSEDEFDEAMKKEFA